MAVAAGAGLEIRRWARTAGLVLILVLICTKPSLSQLQSQPQSSSQPAAPKQSSPEQAKQAASAPNKGTEAKSAPEEKAATGGAAEAANPAKTDDAPKLSPEKQKARDQLAQDTARLYQLANELKTEMDKSTKDTLSLNVIRKADEVEKLAKKVRAEMKANSIN